MEASPPVPLVLSPLASLRSCFTWEDSIYNLISFHCGPRMSNASTTKVVSTVRYVFLCMVRVPVFVYCVVVLAWQKASDFSAPEPDAPTQPTSKFFCHAGKLFLLTPLRK